MDEIDQYKAFTKLVSEGRDASEIAQTFGITERMVAQRLALGNLHGPILTAYHKDEIHARDIRILTMATLKQQKAWWALVKGENEYAPTGQRLKSWLFSGAEIPTANALFDVVASGLAVVSDLFGEDSYFADAEAFWPLQNAAIAEQAEAYKAEGWSGVIVLECGAYWCSWEHVTTSKKDGGKVFITCTDQGEVTTHEGYLTNAEAKRQQRKDSDTPIVAKPELTKAGQNYVDLHRHAAGRSDLLGQSSTALRLIAAHMIAGSSLWDVQAEPQKAAKPEIEDSLMQNTAQQAFEVERAEIGKMLGIDDPAHILSKGHWSEIRATIETIFATLQTLSDDDVTRILTLLMAESLSVSSPLIDTLGQDMQTQVTDHWTPEPLFTDLIRDKGVLNGMVAELAGETAAKEHITATAKTGRAVITACLDGSRICKVENWTPRYMAFPMGSYREGSKPEAVETAIAAE